MRCLYLMQFSKVLFLCMAFLALFLSRMALLQSSFQYGRGFISLFFLFFRCGILSFAALFIASVKSSAFLSADTVSEIRSAVSKFRALILNDCQSAFDRINFSQSSTSSAGTAFRPYVRYRGRIITSKSIV